MRSHRSLTALSLVTLGVALGCGATKDTSGNDNCLANCNDGGNHDDGGFNFDVGGDGFDLDAFTFQDINIDPSNATIYIDTSTATPTPATQTYTAKLNLSGGGTKDVTSEIVLTLDDPALGGFKGNVFTSVTALPGVPAGKVGGITTVVHGNAESKSGTANLTIVQLRKGGDHRDFYFVVPYKSPPSPDHDVLKFGTNIKQVDVAFTQDTTGSMSASIDTVKSTISTTIMPGLVAAIPSVGLAVIDHKDSHDFDPWVVKVDNVINTDPTVSQGSYGSMTADGGGDEPEAQLTAIYYAVTGSSIPSDPAIAAHTPAPGTFGAVDFRAGSLPVVVNITDAHWHDSDDPDSSINTNADTGMKGTVAAFNAAHAKFIGVEDQHYASSETTPYPFDHQPQVFSDATNSNIPPGAFGGKCGAGQCCTGQSGAAKAPDAPGGNCRLVFDIMDGAGIDASLVTAIQAISVGSVFDVTAQPSNDPSNATGSDGKPVDATKFIKDLRAMDEGSPSESCPAHAAKDTNGDGVKDTFTAVVVGTPVCFQIDPQENVTVPPKPAAQFFNAFIDVLGMPGSVKLDHRVVLFLVPPKDPAAK